MHAIRAGRNRGWSHLGTESHRGAPRKPLWE